MDNQMTPSKNKWLFPLLAGFALTILLVVLFIFFSEMPRRSVPSPLSPSIPSPTRMPEKMEEVKKELIEGMPNVPIYPEVIIEESLKRTVGLNVEYIVRMTTEASMSEIISFYQTELSREGWVITAIPEDPNSVEEEAGIEATRDNMTLLITLESEDQPTQMVVSVFIKNK